MNDHNHIGGPAAPANIESQSMTALPPLPAGFSHLNIYYGLDRGPYFNADHMADYAQAALAAQAQPATDLLLFKEMHLKMVADWAGDIGEALGEPSEDFEPQALVNLAKRVTAERDSLRESLIAAQAPAQAVPAAVQTLIDFAAGRMRHIYNGDCPTPGISDSRDPYCVVCCAIDAAGQPVQPAPLTDEQISALWPSSFAMPANPKLMKFARAIELAHDIGEKYEK